MKIRPLRPGASFGAKKNRRKNRAGSNRFRAWVRLRGALLRRTGIGAAVVFVVLVLYAPSGPTKTIPLAEGQIAKENIIAPVDFPVLKSDVDLERERTEEARKVLPVVRVSEEETQRILGNVKDFFFDIEGIIDTEGEVSDQHRLISELGVPLSEMARNVLLDLASEMRLRQEAIKIFDEALTAGVLSDRSLFTESGYDAVSVIAGDGEEYSLPLDRFDDIESFNQRATDRGRHAFGDNHSLLTTFYEVVNHYSAANLIYDMTETAGRRDSRRASVSPYTELYLKDQKIIGAHERVTKKHVEVLRSLDRKLETQRTETDRWQQIYPHLGRALILGTMAILFGIFLQKNRPEIYARERLLVLLGVIVLLGIGLASLIDTFELTPYLLPVSLVAMLASLLFDERVGMGLVGAYLVVIGLFEGLPLPLLFTLSVVGVTAAYSVSGLRERKRFWYSLSSLAAAYIISISAADFLHLIPSMDTFRKIGFGLLSAFGCAGITMIALPLFESLFKVTTNITLLELSDLNRPVLKNLSLFAPGTYHHSIMVGNLSESAAERIGANSLLARVGAYYHDIGKMSKPEYFGENQLGGENKHDKLSPKLSALILGSHVREGVELARKDGLPAEIIDAIREHHGTTRMEFFFAKAKKASPDTEIREVDYRYPGPRPRTKENGIIMLADTSEAAVRALENPTPARIKKRVLEVTNAKFADGQLDDCDLSFRDLRLIQASFVPILTSSMHSRIRYPDEIRREEAGLAVGDLFRKPPRKV